MITSVHAGENIHLWYFHSLQNVDVALTLGYLELLTPVLTSTMYWSSWMFLFNEPDLVKDLFCPLQF